MSEPLKWEKLKHNHGTNLYRAEVPGGWLVLYAEDITAPWFDGQRSASYHGVAAVHLAKYYGSDEHGQGADEPLHTIPTVDRFALVAAFLRRFDVIDDDRPYVTVGIKNEQTGEVETFILYDIAMRMLQPRELARAQGFPDTYQLTGTKSQQVARIGNSVCPHVAAAIVRANLDSEEMEEEAVWN